MNAVSVIDNLSDGHGQERRNWEAGGAAAPLAFCWKAQGGQKCPLSINNIIYNSKFSRCL